MAPQLRHPPMMLETHRHPAIAHIRENKASHPGASYCGVPLLLVQVLLQSA